LFRSPEHPIHEIIIDKSSSYLIFSGDDVTTVTISMPDSLKHFLDDEVQTKGYGNVSEYIRTLLRDAQAKTADARLQALLLEGLAGGEDITLTPGFWREIKTDAAQILAKHKATKKVRARK
jgi:antitoxin ParD1/3/4